MGHGPYRRREQKEDPPPTRRWRMTTPKGDVTVKANTKSEARALARSMLNLAQLPRGSHLYEIPSE